MLSHGAYHHELGGSATLPIANSSAESVPVPVPAS